ncbi:MAG: sulfatase-like hydrolase/transferase [Alphaproteobacteria bacterium]|nr:sulfatase-like hydrolase/transferase [Alphaproteobacteria bacterium]
MLHPLPFWLFLIVYLGYTLLAFNTSFLGTLFAELQFTNARDIVFGTSVLWVIAGIMAIVLLLVMWPYSTKIVAISLLFGNAAALYFMDQYQIVIGREMLDNVLATEYKETLDLLSPRLFAYLLLFAGLPSLVILRLKICFPNFWRGLGLRTLLCSAILSIGVGLAYAQYKDFSTYLRLRRDDQSLWIPRNYLWGLYESLTYQYRVQRRTVPLGQEVQYGSNQPPLLVVVVVGEAARAANFSLYGYARDTNPKLRQQPDLLTLPATQSCGTSTAISLPCMFSPLDRRAYNNRTENSELLPSLLARLGIMVDYVSNNFGGCKNVCSGVATEYTKNANDAAYCNASECHDGILLDRLRKRLLPKAKRDQLIILHQNGSHGPRYDKRYPQEFARFLPVCSSADIRACSTQEFINGYDNTILYTDHVLAKTITMLEALKRASIMIYISDHGESLGEGGLYLHGLPYRLAPAVQTEVPFLMWTSPEYRTAHPFDSQCIVNTTEYRHAHLFHTLAGLFGVLMREYQPQWNIFKNCRQ